MLLDDGGVGSLDAILCNAGGRFDGAISYSPDWYETNFATNYLGHFLFVELLFPALTEKGRVVYTASGTHDPDSMDGRMVGAGVEPDAVALANNGKDGAKVLSAGKRYSGSKLCTVMCAYELDRRLRRADSSASSVSFDPGAVPGTGFLRGMPRPVQWVSTTAAIKWVSKRIGVTTSNVEFSGASLAALAADRTTPGSLASIPGERRGILSGAIGTALLRRAARGKTAGRLQAARPSDHR